MAQLPRRCVSLERLCLRGTTDYWVNDAVGRPFVVVSKTVTDGLAGTLLEDIEPELLASVPQQPTAVESTQDEQPHRFVIVFDREGTTRSLLSQLWQQRIGVLTYRKRVMDVWPEIEFMEQMVLAPGGGSAPLARRCARLPRSGPSDDGGLDEVLESSWMRSCSSVSWDCNSPSNRACA